ncbi:hypothetical protein [Haloarcula laminariae]|uniref:hypothetical protein n=1 Tax=Haloarcula laminariae TaxID=2961577 RepID=UPI002404DC6F|nr:hypothetical protein [Halomicroarcula sp. FL173]
MGFEGSGRYVVGLLLVGLGGLGTADGLSTLLTGPDAAGYALAIGKVVVGLVVLRSSLGVARLRKRGLWLSVVGLGGLVAVYLAPLLSGRTGPVPVGTALLSLLSSLYLLLHEYAFDAGSRGRDVSEETNPHEYF